MIMRLFLLLIIISCNSARGEEAVFLLKDSQGKTTHVITGDPQTISYLESLEPNAIVIRQSSVGGILGIGKKLSFRLSAPGLEGDSYLKISAYSEEAEPPPPETPEPQAPAPIDQQVFDAALLLIFGDRAPPMIAWLRGQGFQYPFIFEDRNDVVVSGIQVKIPNAHPNPAHIAADFVAKVQAHVESLDIQARMTYWRDVEGLNDPEVIDRVADHINQVHKNMALSVATYARVYLTGVSMFSQAGAMVIAAEDIKEGNYWAVVDFLPLLTTVSGAGRLAQGLTKVEFHPPANLVSAVGGGKKLKDNAVPALVLDGNALSDLRSIMASNGNKPFGNKVDEFAEKATTHFLSKGIKVWPDWCGLLFAGTMCFSGDTLVTTASGQRPISEIVPGDKILSWNESTNSWCQASVTATDRSLTDTLVEVFFADGRGETCYVQCTPNHPFLVRDVQGVIGWSCAEELALGQQVFSQRGWCYVSGLDLRLGDFKVFNLAIEGTHTYAVGGFGLVAHNKCLRALLWRIYARAPGKKAIRTLIDDPALFAKMYPAITKACLHHKQGAENLKIIKSRLRRAANGDPHEWIPVNNIETILKQCDDPAVAHKFFLAIDAIRSPTGAIWFNNIRASGGMGLAKLSSGKVQRLKHQSVEGDNTAYFFHSALDSVFRNNLRYDRPGNSAGRIIGFDANGWRDEMKQVLGRYFKNNRQDTAADVDGNELRRWMHELDNVWLPKLQAYFP